jgi:hypothetical protein
MLILVIHIMHSIRTKKSTKLEVFDRYNGRNSQEEVERNQYGRVLIACFVVSARDILKQLCGRVASDFRTFCTVGDKLEPRKVESWSVSFWSERWCGSEGREQIQKENGRERKGTKGETMNRKRR